MCIYYVRCVHTCHSPCVGVIGQFVGSLLSWFHVSSRHQAQTVRLIFRQQVPFSTGPDHCPGRKGPSFCFRCICFYFMRMVVPACMYPHHMCACWLKSPEEGIRYFGTGWWKSSPGPKLWAMTPAPERSLLLLDGVGGRRCAHVHSKVSWAWDPSLK